MKKDTPANPPESAPRVSGVVVQNSHFEMGTVHHSKHASRCVEALAAAAAANADAIKEIAKALNGAPSSFGPSINIGGDLS